MIIRKYKLAEVRSSWKHNFQKKILYEIQIISFLQKVRLIQKKIQAQKNIPNLFPKLLHLVHGSEKNIICQIIRT